jgi:hypothetical protein
LERGLIHAGKQIDLSADCQPGVVSAANPPVVLSSSAPSGAVLQTPVRFLPQ